MSNAAFLLALSLSLFAPAAGAAGSTRVDYGPAQVPAHAQWRAKFMEGAILERWARQLDKFQLPKTVTLRLKECGEIEAFYKQSDASITLCYEFIERMEVLLTEDLKAPRTPLHAVDAEFAVLGAATFTFFHEVGHALIDMLQLPSTGREEDAADQLAALVILSEADGGQKAALAAAQLHADSGRFSKDDFASVHSLDPQRFYNITCWVYGMDPGAHADLASSGLLPAERAGRCSGEYQRMKRAWETLLAPHRRQ